jgi:hypothetical protein
VGDVRAGKGEGISVNDRQRERRLRSIRKIAAAIRGEARIIHRAFMGPEELGNKSSSHSDIAVEAIAAELQRVYARVREVRMLSEGTTDAIRAEPR